MVHDLQAEVKKLRGQLDESMIVHVKQHGKISLALREALARAVTEQGTSFAKAYDSVLSSWSVLARTCGHAIEGEIVNKDSKTHAAISSVAMKGRLAQYVLAWEMASGRSRALRNWWLPKNSEGGSSSLVLAMMASRSSG